MTMDSLPKLEDRSDDTVAIPPPAPVQVSEGGVQAWCTAAGGWLALFATFGSSSSFGVYQDLYVRSGTATSSNAAWIGSVQLFFLTVMGLPAGKLLDKGHFRPVILTGSILYVFSLFMLSLVHLDRYYQIFLAQGVGAGIGSGLVYAPSVAIQAHYWREHRALVMGLVITGTSCGGIVFPIMLNHLFHGSVGFAWGVRAQAFLILGLLAAANFLMSQPAQREARPDIPKARLLAMFKDRPYMLMILGSVLIITGFFFPYFYLQLFADLHQLPPNFSFYTLTIQNGASILGRTLPNLFADRMGVFNALILTSFVTGALIFAMFGLTTVGGVATFAVFYGFFSGAVLSLFSPVLVGFAQDVSEVGVRMGFGYFLASFAFLSGPPISGALVSNGIHWSKGIIFNGVIALASFPVLLVARYEHARRRKTPYV